MKLLIDNNISPHIAPAIHALVAPDGHEVVSLRTKYPNHPKDVEWIGQLGIEGGWSVLSNDIKITRRASEREAWRRTTLIGYFYAPSWSKLNRLQQASRLLLWWDRLVTQSSLIGGGALFVLPVNANSKLRQLQV